MAREALVTTGLVPSREITTSTYVDIPAIVWYAASIGYTDAAYGIDADTCAVLTTTTSSRRILRWASIPAAPAIRG